MARKQRQPRRRNHRPKLIRPWPDTLAAMAAAAKSDGGVGLSLLLFDHGYFQPPHMRIIIKREAA